MSECWFIKGGKQTGPVPREELDRLIASGELDPEDRVLILPSTEWTTVAAYSVAAKSAPPLIPLTPVKFPPSQSPLTFAIVLAATVVLMVTIAVPSFMRARMRAEASTVLGSCRQVDAAKDQYALENSKQGTVTPNWSDLTVYLKAGSHLASGGANDPVGNPFIINNIQTRLQVNPKTKTALSVAADDNFWGPYS